MEDITFESTVYVTAEQFHRLVEVEEERGSIYRYELLNGRVVMNPPAGYPHGSVESRIGRRLAEAADEGGLGEVFGSSQGFVLPSGDVVEPDVSFVSRARWSAISAVEGSFLRVVPDLVVEILSPKTASRDRGEKKAIYERNGVTEYWLVDSRARSVTVLGLVDGRYDAGRVFSGEERVLSSALPELELTAGELFPA